MQTYFIYPEINSTQQSLNLPESQRDIPFQLGQYDKDCGCLGFFSCTKSKFKAPPHYEDRVSIMKLERMWNHLSFYLESIYW